MEDWMCACINLEVVGVGRGGSRKSWGECETGWTWT